MHRKCGCRACGQGQSGLAITQSINAAALAQENRFREPRAVTAENCVLLEINNHARESRHANTHHMLQQAVGLHDMLTPLRDTPCVVAVVLSTVVALCASSAVQADQPSPPAFSRWSPLDARVRLAVFLFVPAAQVGNRGVHTVLGAEHKSVHGWHAHRGDAAPAGGESGAKPMF